MLKHIQVKDVVKDWEYYTLKADACYHRNELRDASKQFCKTVDMLEPWLDKDDKQSWSLVRLFVLSCHNAGHVMGKLKKAKEAEYYYSHAHFRLLSLLSGEVHSKKLIEFTAIELVTTFSTLKSFLLAQNKVELANNIREESLRILEHSALPKDTVVLEV